MVSGFSVQVSGHWLIAQSW